MCHNRASGPKMENCWRSGVSDLKILFLVNVRPNNLPFIEHTRFISAKSHEHCNSVLLLSKKNELLLSIVLKKSRTVQSPIPTMTLLLFVFDLFFRKISFITIHREKKSYKILGIVEFKVWITITKLSPFFLTIYFLFLFFLFLFFFSLDLSVFLLIVVENVAVEISIVERPRLKVRTHSGVARSP